jgi:integrase
MTDARDKAERLRIAVRDGADPAADAKARRAPAKEASAAPTFAWCAEQYISTHEATWKNEKHAAQWTSTIETYANPIIGQLPVDQVGVDEVLKVLKPIWTTKSETASRLRGRIEKIVGWAEAKKYRSGDNPAAARGPLSHLLPSLAKVQKVVARPSVPYSEVPALVAELRKLNSTSSRALLFTILTCTRTTEAVESVWPEVDVDTATWTIPDERMKAGKEHRVPLVREVLALLGSKGGGYLFPGQRPKKPLSNMAMLQCLRGLRDDGATVHGFRSSFSTWAAEKTDHPREVVEACLAHATGNAVELAYKRTDFFDKRRKVMEDWAAFCLGR